MIPSPRFPAGILAITLSVTLLSPARSAVEYVLHISVDGLRGDALLAAMTATPASYPNFHKIKNEGATTYNARCDFDYSETMPNHCGIVTGRPVVAPAGSSSAVAHAYTSNGYTGNGTTGDSIHKLGTATYSYKSSTFDTAHDRGFSTAVFGGKTRMNLFTDSYNGTKGALDVISAGGDNGRKKIDYTFILDASDASSLASVKTNLVSNITTNNLRKYNLIHFTDTDTGASGGGHAAGWNSAAWKTAVSDVDGYLGAIFTAISANPSYAGKVALVLTADHGGGGGGSGPGATADKNHGDASSSLNYTIPVLIWGAGIPAGIDAYSLFKNRFDPGTGRPTSAPVFQQPLRNNDTGNIALALLGVPPITGSFFKPELKDPLDITQTGNNINLRWPKYLTGYVLQTATSFQPASWTNVTEVPAETPTEYTLTLTATEARRFWQLKRPE